MQFSVTLRNDLNFVTTGGHYVFSLNAVDVAQTDIRDIHDAGLQTFSAVSSATNPPFGTFTYGIVCATLCSNGGSQGGYGDPLTFTVSNSTISDFMGLSTGAGTLGAAYFAADVLGNAAGTPSFGFTGAVGVTSVTPVPEPETYALMLAGLGALGFMSRRRKRD